jgi:hypothetical protein
MQPKVATVMVPYLIITVTPTRMRGQALTTLTTVAGTVVAGALIRMRL